MRCNECILPVRITWALGDQRQNAIDWIFVAPTPNSYVEILITNMTVLGGGSAFRRWLDFEGGALMNNICAPIKEAPENSLTPFSMWGHTEKKATMHQTVSPHQTLNLLGPWLWTSQPTKEWEINFHCVYITQFMIFCYGSPNELGQLLCDAASQRRRIYSSKSQGTEAEIAPLTTISNKWLVGFLFSFYNFGIFRVPNEKHQESRWYISHSWHLSTLGFVSRDMQERRSSIALQRVISLDNQWRAKLLLHFGEREENT